MTSLPPENAPQLGYCGLDIHHNGAHFQKTICVDWKPVAAPENQPRPKVEWTGINAMQERDHTFNAEVVAGEAQVEKHPPVDELLSKIEAYRTGYSCGYSDAKAGSRMRDKDAAALFYGIEGVPDIFADDSPLTPYGEKLKLMKVGEAQGRDGQQLHSESDEKPEVCPACESVTRKAVYKGWGDETYLRNYFACRHPWHIENEPAFVERVR